MFLIEGDATLFLITCADNSAVIVIVVGVVVDCCC